MSKEKNISRRRFITAGVLAGIRLALPYDLTAQAFSPDYKKTRKVDAYIAKLVSHPPAIGGVENYRQRLHAGIGFATLHLNTLTTADNNGGWIRNKMDDKKIVYDDLSQQDKNIYNLTQDGKEKIPDKLDIK